MNTTKILSAENTGAGKQPLLIAGPCSAETRSQTLGTAQAIAAHFPDAIFRAGIWKPRTQPGSFEGVGVTGLEWLRAVKLKTGLRTATEVANAAHVEACLEHQIDLLWIGARTTVNPFSVQEIADALRGVDIPVLIKNPVHADLALWIGALERLSRAGIKELGAIHRGFHQADTQPFRNAPLWEKLVELRTRCPEIPVICDPSHICGNTALIPYVSKHALDLGLDGLMIETHIVPQQALSDAAQQLTPAELQMLVSQLRLRSKTSPADDLLQNLRGKINRTDEQLLRLLFERMKISKAIGNHKQQRNLAIVQPSRWEEVLGQQLQLADALGLKPDFVKEIYTLIHEQSVKEQMDD
ncbi:MAG: chorismate mutase [Bacteroidetes bacterium]|nr:MAG: chorismate mutase [Bacteroidota bacterium]